MKKTFITLLTLAGMVGAAERGDNLWSIEFSNAYQDYYNITSTNGCTPSKVWDTDTNNMGAGYVGTAGDKRLHIEWENQTTGINWGDNFGIELVFTLPNNYGVSENTVAGPLSLITLSTSDRNHLITFGPDTTTGMVHFAGSVATENEGGTDLTLTTDIQHTAQLEFYNGSITLKIDGDIIQTGTLKESATGTISEVMIGGGWVGSGHVYSNWIQEKVHSVTAYKMIPEPTTATLSLLALVGLAARRRRASR